MHSKFQITKTTNGIEAAFMRRKKNKIKAKS